MQKTMKAAGQWICFLEGQQHLAASAHARMLVQPNRDHQLRVQIGRASQLLSPEQCLLVPAGVALDFFCMQSLHLYCVDCPTSGVSDDSSAGDVRVLQSALLLHAREIYQCIQQSPARDCLRNAWEQLLLVHLTELAYAPEVDADEANVIRLNQFIDQRLSHPITADDLCLQMEIGRAAFLRWCKQRLGCTPCQYVIQRRLERAKNLLAVSEMPQVEIALQTGFASQAHFANAFKAASEQTPGEYRRQFRLAA